MLTSYHGGGICLTYFIQPVLGGQLQYPAYLLVRHKLCPRPIREGHLESVVLVVDGTAGRRARGAGGTGQALRQLPQLELAPLSGGAATRTALPRRRKTWRIWKTLEEIRARGAVRPIHTQPAVHGLATRPTLPPSFMRTPFTFGIVLWMCCGVESNCIYWTCPLWTCWKIFIIYNYKTIYLNGYIQGIQNILF